MDLTPEERRELVALLKGASLNGLLGEWARFVRAVESGYDDSIYEYTNDLSVRDQLDALISGSSKALAEKVKAATDPIDRRFTDATEAAARPLSAAAVGLAAWWCRVPKRRDGELAADLVSMGYAT